MENTKQMLSEKAEEIEQTLKEFLDIENVASSTLVESMQYTTFAGGKRIRPILTMMTASLVGGEKEISKKVGAVIELIHTYSLIHDDLPSMDNDDYRRGKLTNHQVYGSGIAILSGDALLTYAFNIVSGLDFDSDKLLQIINLISEGAGFQGMVGGQVLDLEGENKNLTLKEMQKIHTYKTAALFKTSILAGACCGDPTEEEIKALNNFAYNLGILFQIIDDVLDIVGDEKKLGKSTGQDKKMKKSTYPALLGLEESKKKAETYASRARNALKIFGEKAEELKILVDFV